MVEPYKQHHFQELQKHKSLSQWDTSIVESFSILSKDGFILDFNGGW